MAEPWWKRAAGAFLEPALLNCLRARAHLGAALRDLESEELLHTRDAAGRYVVLDCAARNVEQASWFLAISMYGMVGVELLALRGCGPDPTHPVASVDDTRDARHGMWLTLARLRSAREDGQVALRAAEAAVGHLQAAQFMATRLPPVAGLHAVMEDQVHAAVNKILPLRGGMFNMCFLLACTVEPAARIHWT
ncbi:hypothetical protein ACQ4PT_008559 [Festuca glaucescens]